jgi:hypothetical protein
MASVEDGLRHFWLPDIHKVGGVTRLGFPDWMAKGDLLISIVTGPANFSIRVLTPDEAIRSIAHDSTRMASAAFETMLGLDSNRKLPKSTAWIVIRTYYAAFFAAHSLLRMFGTICGQLDRNQVLTLDRIATDFGQLPSSGFEAGFYVGRYDSAVSEIHFQKPSSQRGSHEILWVVFAQKLRDISNHLLSVSATFTDLSLQLSEMESLLRQEGLSGGNWLSYVRNIANYQHGFGLWFPYLKSTASGSELVKIASNWNKTSGKSLVFPRDGEVKTHVRVCTSIVAMCHAVACDMETHGIRQKCFHSYGGLALARLAM